MPNLRLKNVLGTITSLLSNAATVARQWVIPDKDGTIAMLDDIPDVSGFATNSDLTSHTSNTSNPHSVTKAQVGLGNVPNLSFSGSNTGDQDLSLYALTTAMNTAIDNASLVTQVSVTGAVTLDATAFGKIHILSGTSADYTVGLPTAVGNTGRSIGFKAHPLTASFNKIVTIDANSTETIDGIITRQIATGGQFILVSDGANWFVLYETESTITYSSVPVGFSSISVESVTYRLKGKNLQIDGVIQGTSNSTGFSFSMPPNMNIGNFRNYICRVANSGTFAAGYINVSTSAATTIIVRPAITSTTDTAWSATGGKQAFFSIQLTIS